MEGQSIGIIDDGFGGLAALISLNELLPHENVIYLSDTAHFPYEKDSPENVGRFIASAGEVLAAHGAKLVINACGYAGTALANNLPCGVPCIGMHFPAAQAACSSTRNGKIGVVGSASAVQSGYFGKAVKTIRPGTSVAGSFSPLIAPAVIGDYIHRNPELLGNIIDDCLSPLKEDGVDTIILGSSCCNFIRDEIAAAAGGAVTVISPVREAVKAAELFLFEHGLLSESEEPGETSYLVSGSEDFFKTNAAKLCGGKLNGKIIAFSAD